MEKEIRMPRMIFSVLSFSGHGCLPQKKDQPVMHPLHIGFIAIQMFLQEPFLDKDPQNYGSDPCDVAIQTQEICGAEEGSPNA